MTVKDLEQLLSMVPDDTPVRFEIEGCEGCATSAMIKHTVEFTTEQGDLSPGPEVESLMIAVSYGPEEIPE